MEPDRRRRPGGEDLLVRGRAQSTDPSAGPDRSFHAHGHVAGMPRRQARAVVGDHGHDRPVQTGVLRGTGRPRVCGHGPSVDAAPSGLSSETNLSSAGRTRAAASRTAGRLRHRRPGAVPRWVVTSPGISPSFRCRPLRRWDRTSRRRRARLGPPLMISSPPVISNNRPYQKPESSEERR